jgi:hypothetical protein
MTNSKQNFTVMSKTKLELLVIWKDVKIDSSLNVFVRFFLIGFQIDFYDE